MRSITTETQIVVSLERLITLQLPRDIVPGKHRAILVIDEQSEMSLESAQQDFPVLHVKSWPENLSLRREEMYA